LNAKKLNYEFISALSLKIVGATLKMAGLADLVLASDMTTPLETQSILLMAKGYNNPVNALSLANKIHLAGILLESNRK
jgi:hypothetical protein